MNADQSSPISQEKIRRIELLTFDKEQKVYYAGYCNIFINNALKVILVQPENEGKNFKPISASFSWTFIQVKQLLWVLSDGVIDNFALVFENETDCKNIMEIIHNSEIPNESSSNIISESQKELYEEKCILALLDQFYNPNIAAIVYHLIKYFNENEKQKLINLLKSENLYETLYGLIFEEKKLKNGKVKAVNNSTNP
uniref:Uncharacterized protein n=1 Tax=Panagrolaimus superbus TaxID=310955 RepID=A0A914YVU5_9BILA